MGCLPVVPGLLPIAIYLSAQRWVAGPFPALLSPGFLKDLELTEEELVKVWGGTSAAIICHLEILAAGY